MDKLKKEEFKLEIAAYVAELLEDRVENAYADDHVWRTHFMDCVESIESDIAQTEDEIVELGEDRLTLNALEHEGYLRGLKTVLATITRFMPKED
jgi:hypothetical protein